MKLPISLIILATLVSISADARVTRKNESGYLSDATQLGACKDLDVYQTLEKIYTYCDASDGQFDKLNEAYDDSGAKCDADIPSIIQSKYQIMIQFQMIEC